MSSNINQSSDSGQREATIRLSHTGYNHFFVYLPLTRDLKAFLSDNGNWGKEFGIDVEDGFIYIYKLPMDYYGDTYQYRIEGNRVRFFVKSDDLSVGIYKFAIEDEEIEIET